MMPGEPFAPSGIGYNSYNAIPLSTELTAPSPSSSLTTITGIPIGLTKNANSNRIALFVTSPVIITATAMIESKLLAILKTIAEQEISPALNQMNKLTMEVMSIIGIFNKIFM